MTKEFIQDLVARYTGRKFVAVVVVCAFVVFAPSFGITLSEVQLDFIQWVLLGFVGVEGAADIVTRKTNIPPVDEPKRIAKSKA